MEDKKKEKKTEDEGTREFPDRDHPQKYHAPESKSEINNPNRALPAFNPPVPNRAWTAMRQGIDIDELTDEEKRDMYYGRDDIF